MIRPRKSAGERRLEIIRATLHLAAELGPERITADAIAKELDLSQPAIFRHFPRKENIWAATIIWLGDHMAERWAEAAAATDDPAGRLEAILRAQFATVQAIPALPAILLSPELQTRHDDIRQALMALMARFHGELTHAIALGKQTGLWHPDLHEARAAWMLIALLQGTAIRWTSSQYSFDLVAEGMAVVTMAMAGLRIKVGPQSLTPVGTGA